MDKVKNILIVLFIISNLITLSLLIFIKDNNSSDGEKTADIQSKEISLVQSVLDTIKKNPNVYLDEEKLRLIMPQGDSIMIYCNGCYIPVKNFYKYAIFIFKDSSAVFYENDDFTCSYSAPYKTFHITIHNENILLTVQNAENKFMELLKINEFQACTLTVLIGIDKSFQDYAKGTPYYLCNNNSLSFCGCE